LLRRELGQLPEYFAVHSWRVFTQSHPSGPDGQETDTECTVRLSAKGISLRVVGEGNGPVNALDHAVRNALLPAYPVVDRFNLIDYKVRILDQGHGTDATVRVLIQTTDGRHVWTTVGVGQNIIEASWEALSDAYLYGLIHSADADPGLEADPSGSLAEPPVAVLA
jgi:2-isopropylmalate synthase